MPSSSIKTKSIWQKLKKRTWRQQYHEVLQMRPLTGDFAKVLYDNLDELYITDTPLTPPKSKDSP